MREEVISSVGGQKVETSRYQVCDLESRKIDFQREDATLNMVAIFAS